MEQSERTLTFAMISADVNSSLTNGLPLTTAILHMLLTLLMDRLDALLAMLADLLTGFSPIMEALRELFMVLCSSRFMEGSERESDKRCACLRCY